MLIITCSSATQAAEIKKIHNHPMKCQYLLDGKIQDGDTEKVREKFSEIDRFPDHLAICLNSTGGSYLEALRLAKYLNEGIATVIPEQSRCENACAIAFLGGRFIPSGNPDFSTTHRTIHPTAIVGFSPISRELLLNEGSDNMRISAYQHMLAVIAELAAQRGFFGLKLHDSLFEKLVGNSNQPVYYIKTVGDAVLNGIHVHNVGFNPKNITATIENICNNVNNSIWRRNTSVFSNHRVGKIKYIKEHLTDIRLDTEYGFGQEGLEPCQIHLSGTYRTDLNLKVGIQINGQYVPYHFFEVPSVASFPFDTKLKNLANTNTLNTQEFKLKAKEAFNPTKRCSIRNKNPKIINVQSFTNLRIKSNVNSQILDQVPLGSEVSVSKPTFFWSKEPCTTACLDRDQKQIQSCINQDLVWIKVQYKGQEGFLSRRFLK